MKGMPSADDGTLLSRMSIDDRRSIVVAIVEGEMPEQPVAPSRKSLSDELATTRIKRMSVAERHSLVASIISDTQPLGDSDSSESQRTPPQELWGTPLGLAKGSVTSLQELSQPLVVESLDEHTDSNRRSTNRRSSVGHRRSATHATLMRPPIRKRSSEDLRELSEPSCISLVELSCPGLSDRPAHTWRRARRSYRCVQAIARCRTLAAQRKEAEFERWRQALDSEERLVLEKLYALGALNRSDPIARQDRFVKTTRKAGKAVDDKCKAEAKPKRGAAVADAINSICRPKGRSDQSKPASDAAPVRRMNSQEVAALLGMREQLRQGGNAPMVSATTRRADRANR